MLSDPVLAPYADQELKNRLAAIEDHFPGKIKEYVDWNVVEALGSVQKYPKEIDAQIKLHGMTPEAKAAIKAAEEAKLAAQLQAAIDAEEYAKNHYEIMPGLMVQKVMINRAA